MVLQEKKRNPKGQTWISFPGTCTFFFSWKLDNNNIKFCTSVKTASWRPCYSAPSGGILIFYDTPTALNRRQRPGQPSAHQATTSVCQGGKVLRDVRRGTQQGWESSSKKDEETGSWKMLASIANRVFIVLNVAYTVYENTSLITLPSHL